MSSAAGRSLFVRLAFALGAMLALGGCPPLVWPPPPPDDTHPPSPPPAVCEGAPARRFSLVVLPDTQYLFDQDRGDARVLAASLRWVVENRARYGISFVAQLGDLVENAGRDELAAVSTELEALTRAGVPWSVVAGNHDLRASNRTDSQRAPGSEPYLEFFGPARFAQDPTLVAVSPDGFNRVHVFAGGGQRWLLLALDWRPSDATLAWARDVMARHPGLPVIVTTHELGAPGADGSVVLGGHGQRLWDNLVKDHDQVFLTLNGHFWPPSRSVLRNSVGHDVQVHLTNYQDRYYGGSGMIRLYEFDLDRNRIEVSTFSPWVKGRCPSTRTPLEAAEAELVDPGNRFTLALDFAARFAGFQPRPMPAPVPAERLVVPGTLAYWRVGEAAAAPAPAGLEVRDLSGQGNHLRRVVLSGGQAGDLSPSDQHHPAAPSHRSLFFNGAKHDPAFGGAYLRTADDAPLNAVTLDSGYTVEAFLRLPDDCCGSRHAWMGVVARLGTGAQAGRSNDDPSEPVGTLTITPGRSLQWAVYPRNRDAIATNWGHEMGVEAGWVHVAVVNDGQHTVMYVEGSPVLRNPRAANVGVSTTGAPWLVGATHYDNVIEQSFYGHLGDVRIVARPLAPSEFMNAVARP